MSMKKVTVYGIVLISILVFMLGHPQEGFVFKDVKKGAKKTTKPVNQYVAQPIAVGSVNTGSQINQGWMNNVVPVANKTQTGSSTFNDVGKSIADAYNKKWF